MKTLLLSTALALTAGVGAAQEVGRVLSVTPVVQQFAQPRQVCSTETIITPSQRSGAGAALGALAGGALGNAVGQGGGRAAATILGIVGGAVVGDRVEGQGAPHYQNVQHCSTRTVWENQTVYYNVVYEYGGRQYNVQMPRDPGPTVNLQVTPVDALPAGPPPSTQYIQPAPPQAIYTQPEFVAVVPGAVYSTPYPGYYVRPTSPPIGVNLQFGFGNGPYYRQHRHNDGRWR